MAHQARKDCLETMDLAALDVVAGGAPTAPFNLIERETARWHEAPTDPYSLSPLTEAVREEPFVAQDPEAVALEVDAERELAANDLRARLGLHG